VETVINLFAKSIVIGFILTIIIIFVGMVVT